jgi:O-antigen/teichoic acid export membrane protein
MKDIQWSILEQAIVQIISFSTNIILMAYLLPKDFGVFAIPLLVFALGRTIQDLGTSQIVFTQASLDRILCNQIFGYNIITTIAIGCLMLGIMPLILHWWTDDLESKRLMTVLAILFFMTIPSVVYDMVLRRKLEYKRLFFANVGAVIISSIIGIWLAKNGYSSNALLIRQVSFILLLNLILVLLSSDRLKPDFNFSILKEYKNFTRPLFYHQILNFATRNFDNILVGRYLGNGVLGLYDRSYKILVLPIDQVAHVASRVFLPKIANHVNNPLKQSQLYTFGITAMLLVSFPGIGFVFSFIDPIVENYLDKSWLNMTGLLKIFVWIIPAQIISVVSANILLANQVSKLQMRISLMNAFILFIIFLYFTKFKPNLPYMIIGYGIISYATCILLASKAFNLMDLKFQNVKFDLAKLIGALLIVMLGFFLIQLMIPRLVIGIILLCSALLMLVYIAFVLYMFPNFKALVRSSKMKFQN